METQPTLADQVATALMLLLFTGSLTTWLFIWRRVGRHGVLLKYVPRLNVPWRGIDVLLIAVFYISAQVVAAAAALAAAGVDREKVDMEKMLPTPGFLLGVALANVVTAAVAVVWLRRVRGAGAADLGWTGRSAVKDVSLGLLGLLTAAAPVYTVQSILIQWFPKYHPIVESLERDGHASSFAMATLVTVVAAPLVEEIVFRLALQGWLEARERRWRRRYNLWRGLPRGLPPILISSFVFAAVHFSAGPAPVALFFLALVLGYLYQRTHRILPSIVTHAAFNATSMVMLMLAKAGGA